MGSVGGVGRAKVRASQAVGYTVLACGQSAADGSQLLQEVNLNVSYDVALFQFYVVVVVVSNKFETELCEQYAHCSDHTLGTFCLIYL